jgi:hypothetical protein
VCCVVADARGGWPPHSPDLNPLDFYLWDYLTFLVYLFPVDDVETLHKQTGRFSDNTQHARAFPMSLGGNETLS